MVKSGAYDSRLLLNLIKADKEVHDSFKQYTFVCENANNALNGWAAADTGDSPDVLTASNRVCELFDEAFEAQKTYLIGLNNYRASLKDVSAREAEIRVIMRDRDIFVSRLVKLNSKKTPTSDSAFEAHSGKLEEARAELAACESTLKSEERALVGVKRRIFREALRMRMRAMAQLADTWRDTAEKSIDILDSLDPDNNASMNDLRLAAQQPQAPPPTHIHGTPHSQRHSRNFDMTSPEGSVIAPSHSASQVARRAAGYGDDEYSEDERENRGTVINNGRARRESSATQPIEEADERGGSSDEEGMNPQRYQVHVNKPLTPAELAAQKQQRSNQDGLGMASTPVQQQNVIQPAPSQVAQPRAAQPNTLTSSAGAGGGLTNGIRKRLSSAPTPSNQPQATAAPVARSGRETAEERQKRFSTLGGDSVAQEFPAVAPAIVLPSASAFTVEAHRKKTAPEATLILPSSNTRTTSYRATRVDSDDESAATEQRDEVRSLNKSSSGRKLQSKRSSQMYQGSDAGGSTVRGGSRHEKSRSEGSKGGLFGTIGSLFKKRDVSQLKAGGRDEDDDEDGMSRSRSGHSRSWSSRTDTNIAKTSDGKKKKKKSKQEDSDSDAPDPRSLIRVQNDMSSRNSIRPVTMTYSDIGVPRNRTVSNKVTPASTWVPPPERERQRSMSDVGVAKRAAPASAVKRKSTIGAGTGSVVGTGASGLDRKTSIKSTATTGTTGTVKKKKKVVPAAGTGTAGSAPAGTLSVPPTLTSSSRASSYDAGALVNNVVYQQGANRVTNQNPAQRVTRDTPSLMSVVAPSSQTATIGGMHMPSAKNPGLSRSNSMASYSLGTLPPPSSASNVGVAEAPLKKKKTVKRSSTVGDVAGAAPVSSMTTSATSPSLLPPSSAVAKPKAPASILSDGSAVGRRKSVRLASDTRVSEAKYDNAGGPANIRPIASSNGQSYGGGNAQEYNQNGEWSTRIGRDPDISSDEEGDEYAKIRMQLNKSERDWRGAGFLDKGKGRASVQ